MARYRAQYALLFLCLPLQGLLAQRPTSSVADLTHLCRYTQLNKKRIDVVEDSSWGRWNYRPVIYTDGTKYARSIDASTPTSAEFNIVIKSLIGRTDILLNPRQYDGYTKGNVKLTGKRTPYMQYIWPCDWSSEGSKLLIVGSSDADSASSIWRIDLNTMQGIPVSRILSDEYTDGARFSPDGKFVTYVVTPVLRGGGYSQNPRNERILIANADGSNTRRLAQGLEAEWSPDSHHLLIATPSKLWIIDSEGKGKKLVFPVQQAGPEHYPHYESYYVGRGKSRYLKVLFGRMGWLDATHLIVTVVSRSQGYRNTHNVWIMDTNGKVIQTIPLVSLVQVWGGKRTLALLEEHPGHADDTWLIKY